MYLSKILDLSDLNTSSYDVKKTCRMELPRTMGEMIQGKRKREIVASLYQPEDQDKLLDDDYGEEVHSSDGGSDHKNTTARDHECSSRCKTRVKMEIIDLTQIGDAATCRMRVGNVREPELIDLTLDSNTDEDKDEGDDSLEGKEEV